MTKKKEVNKNIDLELPPLDSDYDEWLEFFRTKPVGLLAKYATLRDVIPTEGYSALMRWREIIENPSKMDKLYQGRLKAQADKNIMQIAVGDDDEAFYVALIEENVQQLNNSNVSTQETARLTQNINIFRKELRDIRSRKPAKGTVLERVLKEASLTTKQRKSNTAKTPSKGSKAKKTGKDIGKKKEGSENAK